MLKIGTATVRNCQGVTRRELLQVGGISALGLGLPAWLSSQHAHAAGPATEKRDVSCIFVYLDGGPSHFETFDPKPGAPDSVRGPYGTISTQVPDLQICELLPMLAGQMDKCALIRSLNHTSSSHSPLPMMTGFTTDTTSFGAVVTKLKQARGAMPPYVHIGSRLGVGGGVLGPPYGPLEVQDPLGKKAALPQFSLAADIPAQRFEHRRELLGGIDRLRADLHANRDVERMDSYHRLAIDMLTSAKVREAFDLNHESGPLRDRYGANFFGQSCLMARRLVEAGTRFIQIRWYDGPAFDGWDTHGADLGGMVRMEQHLCPRLDQGLSALVEDFHQRGLLETTLVVATGEFGRTPALNRFGARDHWPYCFSVFLAGGGVPGGAVIGASDRQGGRPARRPVGPLEFAATLYRLLGIDTSGDPRVRPFIKDALPVAELVS